MQCIWVWKKILSTFSSGQPSGIHEPEFSGYVGGEKKISLKSLPFPVWSPYSFACVLFFCCHLFGTCLACLDLFDEEEKLKTFSLKSMNGKPRKKNFLFNFKKKIMDICIYVYICRHKIQVWKRPFGCAISSDVAVTRTNYILKYDWVHAELYKWDVTPAQLRKKYPGNEYMEPKNHRAPFQEEIKQTWKS